MPANRTLADTDLLKVLAQPAPDQPDAGWAVAALLTHLTDDGHVVTRPTLNRHLARLVGQGRLDPIGEGRNRRYRIRPEAPLAANSVTLTAPAQLMQVVSRALELYARMGCGQLEELDALARHGLLKNAQGSRPSIDDIEEAAEHLYAYKRAVLGFARTASHGIFSTAVNPEFQKAWALYQAIRHRLAWDRTPEGGLQVSFDEPMQQELLQHTSVKSMPDEQALKGLPDGAHLVRRGGQWLAVMPAGDGKTFRVLGESASLQTAVTQAQNTKQGRPARSFAL